MGIFSKMRRFDDDEDDFDDDNGFREEEDDANIALSGINMELKVIKPSDFEQILSAADYLLEGRTVLLNLEGVEKHLCRRMIDFIGGVAYALGSNIKKATQDSYFIAPRDVDVSGEVFESTKDDDETFSNI